MALADTVENQVIAEPAESGRKLATLVVVQGSDADLGAHARIVTRVVVGRDPAAELSLSDARASKQHAAVERVEGLGGRVRYELKDLGSTNGTLLNGKKVKSTRKLKDGDKISIASTVLRFSFADEVDAAFQAQVEAMLSTDALTGLLAPRRFDAALDEALRAAHHKNQTLALVVLDIDHLKQINDTHGHAMGAFTIGQVGHLLAAVVGARGTATRFGGDEFVAFFPGLDATAAAQVAEELRDRIARHPFTREKKTVKPTVSAGVAVFPVKGTTRKAIFEAADRALYRAKARGKDRVAH
ncbi:MAG: GGDEF domain-containing protein [Archangiaceae bacterium]|nr:GGDEF domain-containing protein [Archangiaceae bacterium]